MIAALVFAAALSSPNPALTPGLVRPLLMVDVCAVHWRRDARHVTVTMKRHVAQAYGIPWVSRSFFEFDHLIPRALAGADNESNVWPQPRDGTWNAHRKDVLENRLHRLVCAGTLPLEDAQAAIARDWIAAYRRYVR